MKKYGFFSCLAVFGMAGMAHAAYNTSFLDAISSLGVIKMMTAAPAEDAVVAKMLLPIQLDRCMHTGKGFNLKDGTFVHVAISRSVNCSNGADKCSKDRPFIVFTTENKQFRAVHGYSVLNIPVVRSGKKEISFDGDDSVYTVRMKAGPEDVTNPEGVNVVVKRGKDEVFKAKVSVILNAMGAKAKRFNLGGKPYYISFFRDLKQDAQHNASFNGTSTIAILPAENITENPFYQISVKDYSPFVKEFPELPGYVFEFDQNGTFSVKVK